MFRALKRYADFNGRSSRSEFWLYVLLVMIVCFTTAILDVVLFGESSLDEYGQPAPTFILTSLAYIFFLIPSLSSQVRRLHDTDRSGWWILIGLIPLVGGIIALVFMVQPGSPRRNRFGNPPKETPGRVDDNQHSSFAAQPSEPDHYNARSAFERTSSEHLSGAFVNSEPFSRNKPASKDEWLDRLEKLAKLKADGILTEEEFDAEKAKVLATR
jgi:uncharacterized membrane protein YhaH (DUF805 family)